MKSKYLKLIGLLIIVLILGLVLTGNVFADESTAVAAGAGGSGGDGGMFMLDFIHGLAKLFLLLWYIPAIIAGKMLTNEFVFGSVINLDVYLWKMWNIMKNFANFFLGFYLIAIILKSFFKGEPGSILKKEIPKLMIAGVLIQASWFIMGVLVDISTIMIMAVGSFPMQYFNTEANRASLKASYCATPKEITILKIDPDPKALNANFGTKKVDCNDDAINNLLANANDMSGPLMFFGFSVLRFQEYGFLSSDTYSEGKLVYQELMKSFVIIMFVIPLILLAVVSLMRVVYIWLWIVFSPFLVIDNVFDGLLSKKGGGEKLFKFSNVIGLILQPVVMIGCLGLGLILVTSMSNMFSGNTNTPDKDLARFGLVCEKDYKTCSIQPLGTGSDMKNYGTFTVEGTMLKDTSAKNQIKGGLGYIIVTFMTIFLLWALIKVGFSTSKLTSKLTDAAFGFIKEAARATPIIPGIGASASSIKRGLKQIQTVTTQQMQAKDADRVQKWVNDAMGMESDLTQGDINAIHKSLESVSADFDQASTFWTELRKRMPKNMQLNSSPNVKNEILNWLRNKNGINYLLDRGVIDGKAEDLAKQDLRTLMQNKHFRDFINQSLSGILGSTDYRLKESFLDKVKAKPTSEDVMSKTYSGGGA